MSAALAVQKAIRARLVSSQALTALVPASNILDRNSRPTPMPSIILGEDQTVDESDIGRRNSRIFSTLHVWKEESGLTGAKAIAGAIRASIRAGAFPVIDGFHFADCRISSERFLRDPDGKTAHGVVTIETVVAEV